MLVMTYNVVTQLPTDSSIDDVPLADVDQDDPQGRDRRNGQVLKLFPDVLSDVADGSERKGVDVEKRREKALLLFDDQDTDMMMAPVNRVQPQDRRDTRLESVEGAKQQQHDVADGREESKGVDSEKRREKALLLFDDQDDEPDMMVAPENRVQPDDHRDMRQGSVEDAKQQEHEEQVDKKVENDDAEMAKHNSNDNNDDGGDGGGGDGGGRGGGDDGQLLMNDVAQSIRDKTDLDVDDRHDNSTDSRRNGPLLENVRAVGAIVQRIKRQSAGTHGVAEVDDGHMSVNPHPFRYTINCPQLCATVEHLLLVVYVHTAVGHYKRRTVIRQTWGDVSQYDVDVRVAFVMGIHAGGGSQAQDTQAALMFEAERYQDIVQVWYFSTAELTNFGYDSGLGKSFYKEKVYTFLFIF